MIRIAKTMRNVFMAILNGDYVLRLGIDRLLGHVLFLFLVVLIYLVIMFFMDQTMVELEDTKAELDEVETLYYQRSFELAECERLENIRQNLKKTGSKVGIPQKPARKL